MSIVDLVAFLLGAVMPPIVALVNRAHWPTWAKAAVGIGSCVVAGTATAWVGGQLGDLGWAQAVLVCYAASQAAYGLYWKRSATAIEVATTPQRPTVGGD